MDAARAAGYQGRMAIDAGKWHIEDAGTMEKACRHIALFLAWAAGRGLAGAEVDAKALAKRPTAYLIAECDGELAQDDLGAEGKRFARAEYDAYLLEVHEFAASRGLEDYEIPDDAATAAYFRGWLDAQLDAFRAKPKKKPAAKKPAAKKPAAKKAAAKKAAAKKAAVKKPAAKKAAAKKPAAKNAAAKKAAVKKPAAKKARARA